MRCNSSYQKYPAYFVPTAGQSADYGSSLMRQMQTTIKLFGATVDKMVEDKTSQVEASSKSLHNIFTKINSAILSENFEEASSLSSQFNAQSQKHTQLVEQKNQLTNLSSEIKKIQEEFNKK